MKYSVPITHNYTSVADLSTASETAMQQIVNQLLSFLQQGIAAIFKFLQLIWTWSLDQIIKVFNAPWAGWPLWKQILFIILVVGLVYILYKAFMELWESGERALGAFANLLSAFIKVLPRLIFAGLVALAGMWFLTTADLSKLHLKTPWSTTSTR